MQKREREKEFYFIITFIFVVADNDRRKAVNEPQNGKSNATLNFSLVSNLDFAALDKKKKHFV